MPQTLPAPPLDRSDTRSVWPLRGAPTAAVAGTWTPVTLPSPPGSADSYQLNGVACPTPATCVATGYYGPQGAVRNLAETLSHGTWTPAGPPPPPLGLADPNPGLYGVSCPVPGACVAVGQYDDQNSNPHGLIETLSGGTWTRPRRSCPLARPPWAPNSTGSLARPPAAAWRRVSDR